MKAAFIYFLKDPTNPIKGYVGKAVNPEKRFKAHIDRSRKEKWHSACWISSLLSRGLLPELEVLAQVPESDWQQWEIDYIAAFKTMGFDLVNTTDGGDGCGSGESAFLFGKKQAPETVRKRVAKLIGKKRTPAQRAAIGAPKKGKKQTPTCISKRRLGMLGICHKDNQSGFVGVSFQKHTGKWDARCRPNRKQIYLGGFVKIEDAVFARALAMAIYFSP